MMAVAAVLCSGCGKESSPAGTVNGREISYEEFDYFFRAVRSDIISEIQEKTGKDFTREIWDDELGETAVREYVAERVFQEIASYETLVTLGTENGVVSWEEAPFGGGDLESLQQNDTIYGPESYLEEQAMALYISEVTTALKEKLFLPVADAELEEYYNAHKAEYKPLDDMTLRRLFLSYADSDFRVDEKKKEEQKKLAEDLLGQAKGGADFLALIGTYSDQETDPMVQEDGLYPVVQAGMMMKTLPEEIQQAILELDKGDRFSDVIDTGTGFVILMVEERKEAEPKAFADVAAGIEKRLADEKMEALLKERTESAEILMEEDFIASYDFQ